MAAGPRISGKKAKTKAKAAVLSPQQKEELLKQAKVDVAKANRSSSSPKMKTCDEILDGEDVSDGEDALQDNYDDDELEKLFLALGQERREWESHGACEGAPSW